MKIDKTNIVNLLPGLLVAFLVAAISKEIANFLPKIGAATLAILLGILLGNTLAKHPILAAGTKLAEGKLLEIAIVLLGMTVTFQTIRSIGVKGVGFILFQMTGTIIYTYIIGKKMRFSENMTLLMAGGNAVCGSSAIASIAPVIGAKEEEKGQIITLVNLLGTILMLILPLLSMKWFATNDLAKSAIIGGILPSVGQVVAGANLVKGNILEFTMLFKIMRIMCLVVVVYIFGRIKQHNAKLVSETKINKKKTVFLPWYIIGFLVLCLLNSWGLFSEGLQRNTNFVSNWFEVTALAAIGLRLDFGKFFKEGSRFLCYGIAVGIGQIVLAILLIIVIFMR